MFNPVLMIMQPRQIDVVIDSIKDNVKIPKVWFKAYTEPEVMEEMNKFVRKTNYSHYIIVGDDAIVYKKAVDTVLKYGEMDKYEVFTGWMNMHLVEPSLSRKPWGKLTFEDYDLSEESTVCWGEFPLMKSAWAPTREEYPPWVSVKDMMNGPQKIRQTSMANFGLSCARRELFLEFPLRTHQSGKASDHEWSNRLHTAGIKIWTHPDAFIKHLRRGWKALADHWLVKLVPSETIEELYV